MLALGGANIGQRLDGVQAVLALPPYLTPFIRRRTQSPPPKYYVEFERADHLAWTDANRRRRGAIVACSLAFLDHYVKHEAARRTLRGNVQPAARCV